MNARVINHVFFFACVLVALLTFATAAAGAPIQIHPTSRKDLRTLGGKESRSVSGAAVPGDLNPVNAGVTQIDSQTVQFWMELQSPPVLDPNPDYWKTYTWYVDTDRNPATGQPHGPVGSEYNVRATLRNHYGGGGGALDVIAGGGLETPFFVDGTTVTVRVKLEDMRKPMAFNWNYSAFSWNSPGRSVDEAKTFTPASFLSPETKPVRVVIEPVFSLCDGVTSHAPTVWLFDRNGRRLAPSGHSVKLFAYHYPLTVSSQQVLARTGVSGLTKVSAMADGVVSLNYAWVRVGRMDVLPPLIHLQDSRPTAKVSLVVLDAMGTTLSLPASSMWFSIETTGVATVAPDGTVEALPTGRGRAALIRGLTDAAHSSNWTCVRVLNYPVSLLPEQGAAGQRVSFWYPPVPSPPPGARFEAMLQEYKVPQTLDQVYLRIAELTAVLPFEGGKQHVAALCADDLFRVGGNSGNPVWLGFDPLSTPPGGCVMLDSNIPHWGIMSHEIGHNFLFAQSLSRVFGQAGMESGPAYGEGLATLCNMYARQVIVARPDHYGVAQNVVDTFTSPTVHDSLPFHRRIFVEDRLTSYVAHGAHYPEAFTADVLDGMLIVLAERHGWDIYPRFFSIFLPPSEDLSFYPSNETGRATFFIAAMTAATRLDQRSTFCGWGFPCDDSLFNRLLPELAWRAGQRDGIYYMGAQHWGGYQ